jgi:hypothetical protein
VWRFEGQPPNHEGSRSCSKPPRDGLRRVAACPGQPTWPQDRQAGKAGEQRRTYLRTRVGRQSTTTIATTTTTTAAAATTVSEPHQPQRSASRCGIATPVARAAKPIAAVCVCERCLRAREGQRERGTGSRERQTDRQREQRERERTKREGGEREPLYYHVYTPVRSNQEVALAAP